MSLVFKACIAKGSDLRFAKIQGDKPRESAIWGGGWCSRGVTLLRPSPIVAPLLSANWARMAAISRNKKWERPAAIPFLTDFFYKTRNREFVAEHGPEAMLAVLQIWCEIAREKSLKFDSAKIKYVPFMQKNDYAPAHDWYEKVFCAAVEKGLLERDGAKYFNSQITKFVKESSTYSAAQNVTKMNLRDRRKINSDLANTKLSKNVSSNNKSHLKHLDVTSRILKKSNLKHLDPTSVEKGGANSRGRPAQIQSPQLPENLSAAQKEFNEFVQYRKKIKKKPVTQRVADKIFALYQNEHIAFKNDLLEAIDNGWIRVRRQFSDQNDFATSGGANSRRQTAQNKNTTVDRNLELLRRDAEKEISDE